MNKPSAHFGAPTRAAIAMVTIAVIALLASCSRAPQLDLSEQAARGRTISIESGCAGCHGREGQGVTAPSWQGLYNTRVKLKDAPTVIADDDYLYRAITDPQGEIRQGWTLKMPVNDLTDSQVDDVVAFIKELK